MTAIQCEPKRTVRFYGPLAKVLNRRSFKAVGLNSASETMRCLLSNFPQLESHMRGRHYRVLMNGRAISEDELNNPVGDNHEIHIIPAICGAGGNGALTGILTGAALIAGAFLFPFAASFLTPLGIGLILQGISTLISPTPEDPLESTDPSARSYNFSGIQQTSREGVPVPVVYGEIMTGSVVLSVKVEEDDEELEAEFVPGTGNPNPDPNPVPDEPSIDDEDDEGFVIGPIQIGPTSSTRVRIELDIGIRDLDPNSIQCHGTYAGQPYYSTGSYNDQTYATTRGIVFGRAVRVTLSRYSKTTKAACTANQGDPQYSDVTDKYFGTIEILDYQQGSVSVSGWSVPPIVPFGNPMPSDHGIIYTFISQPYWSRRSLYIYRVFFDNQYLTIPTQLAVPSDWGYTFRTTSENSFASPTEWKPGML